MYSRLTCHIFVPDIVRPFWDTLYFMLYGTGSEKMSYRYIYIKVIKMIHFKIATSPEP